MPKLPETPIVHTRYLHNPMLPAILPEHSWKGTPVDEHGNFVNHQFPFNADWRDLVKWQLENNPHRAEKKNNKWQLPVSYGHDWLYQKEDCIVWLGHCIFFIRLNGIALLTDPVFGDASLLVRRKAPFPVKPALFKNIDLVLLSHDHRDHCDTTSLQLLAKQNPHTHYFCGLGMHHLIKTATGSNHIQTAGWYQQFDTGNLPLQCYFLPARHWSKRNFFDTNKRLWGAFVIQTNNTTIYFSGDTGYGNHFAELAQIFPKIDYSIIGVGAYKPEWLMHTNHTSPANAIKAFQDLKARYFIPMHYGTFDLGDEPLYDPLFYLQQQRTNPALQEMLHLPAAGEPIWI
ncbi:Zn-dependent hydrolase [Sphingobacteriales bacterium UPWRP_1]|nr:Zn-dependent hydrolase [Sphingobacteriales bacterium UPWRP_1]